ncbi:MAG: vWA domain-containing protein [Nannocystales bacterium]
MMNRRWMMGVVALSATAGCTPVEVDTAEPEPLAVANGPDEAPAKADSMQSTTPSQAGSLSVEVVPQYGKVLAGTAGHLDVLVRVQAVEVPGGERPPLDLALVLDRSGSMAGEKLAAAKQAAMETIRKLDPEDRMTFISYDDRVNVHTHRAKVGNGKALRRAVLRVTDGGGTALGPALRSGLNELTHAQRGDDALAHLMLLSDGLANEGESRPEVLANWTSKAFGEGVATTTLGVGLDYNEDLMTRIADAGGGRYHFIETGEQVPEVLADEFAGLTATVARNVTFEVDAAPGIEAGEIPGYPNVVDGDVVMAKVGSISAGRKRELLVRMDYQPPQGDTMALGSYTLRFRDVLDEGAPVEIVIKPTVAVTQDAAEAEASENYAVTVRAQELDVASALQAASEQVDQGNYEEARRDLKRKTEALQQQAAENPEVDYAPMLDDLQEAEGDLNRAKESVQERKRYQKKNKAKAYKKRKK